MLAINEEFESFQGEGTLAGTRMYFIRTQGCDVGCYFCDTKYTWRPEDAVVSEFDLAKRAKESGAEWVCITGGEPLEQDIGLLVHCLKAENLKVQLETSGMYSTRHIRGIDWIVVSPKNLFGKKGKEFNSSILNMAHEVKCVVTKESDVDFYVENFDRFDGYKVFQPVDNDEKIAQMLLKRDDIPDWKVKCQEQKVFAVR